ncbi:MAG: M28 family peptidase [Solirubrobacterales bacterium]
MVDQRLYRGAFAPALVAAIVLLFSLQPVPEPLEAPVSLGSFDGDGAAASARDIAGTAPERTPGSPGDAETADLVTEGFTEIEGAEVSEQSFSSRFDGEDVELRNVIATLPGESERRLVVLASRDSAVGVGAATSAAATAALVELAQTFGVASHRKTLVFVSTAAGSDGAAGVREFAGSYPERDLIDAALVVSQPGAASPEPPFVIPWSTGPQSTAIELTRTAAATVSAELGEPARLEGTFGQLLRLALPIGLGEQGPLIEDGIDAVAISSAGERQLAPEDDSLVSLSETTLGELGQAAQTTILALDALPGRPEHGPGAYIALGDNLIPGWTIAMLSFVLLLPGVVAAIDGFARARRRGLVRPLDLGWVVGRSLPFVGALLLAYLLALVGLLPSPRFPFDPGRFGIDWRAVLVSVLLIAGLAGAWAAVRPFAVPRRGDPQGLIAATGVVMCAGALVTWLLNPYLALFAVPVAHIWIAATVSDPRRRLGLSVAAVCVSLIPGIVALIWLGDRLEVGVAAPWQALLMVADGQIGLGTALIGCLFAGCLVALLAAALTPARTDHEPRIVVRGPDRPAEDQGGARGSGAGGFDSGVAGVEGVDDRRIYEGRSLTIRGSRAD